MKQVPLLYLSPSSPLALPSCPNRVLLFAGSMAILEEHATCSPPTLSVSLLSHPIVTRTGLLPVLAVLVAMPVLAAFMYPQS